jgi:GTP cyclohydrolase I
MGADSKRTMNELNGEINTYLNKVFLDLSRELARQTPKRTGKAAGGWRQSGRYDINKTSEQEVIRNDVNYIAVLETGTSKQAPQGMIHPAVEVVNRRNNK